MGPLRIALAQINVTVGDTEGNAARISRAISEAEALGADIVGLPELAVTGYCTLYGDMAGGFAVIRDVPKPLVYRLAIFCNERANREIIPKRVLTKPPSADRGGPLGPGEDG